MLERIRTSIIAPQELIKFRNDKAIFATLFIMFFALLMTVGPALRILQFSGISNQTRSEIRENFQYPPSGCIIEDAQVNCDDAGSHKLFETSIFNLSFDVFIDGGDTYDIDRYEGNHVVLIGDKMYISTDQLMVQQSLITKDIASMHPDIHNLDFEVTTETRTAFFASVYNTIDHEIEGYMSVWLTVSVVAEFLSGVLLFMVFVLLNSFLIQRRLQKVRFKQMFVMMTYASTLLFIVLIFNQLIMFNFILFIVLLFVGFRQTSKLAFELQKRLYKNE